MRKKPGIRKVSMPAGIGIGVGVSIIVSVLASAILAWLVSSEKIGEEALGTGSIIALILSATAGSLAANLCIGEKKLIVTGLTAATYFVILLAITALIFDGQYQNIGVTAISIFAGGMIAFVPGIILSASGGKRIKIKAFR